VIEQAVDRPAVGARVELVGFAANRLAPFGNRDGETDVNDDGGKSDGGKVPVEMREEHCCYQNEFEDHRDDREQHVAQKRADAARAPLDVARYAARLPIEMETQ